MALNNIFGNARDFGRIGKHQVLAIPFAAFTCSQPNVDNNDFLGDNLLATAADSALWLAPVILPHNAQIDNCIVYGNLTLASETWALNRIVSFAPATNTVCTALVNVKATANQLFSVVDNRGFFYVLQIANPGINGRVYAAVIEYTI